VVTKVQERIRKFYDSGYQIVIFGKKDHAEVIGLVGQTDGEAVVVKSADEIGNVDLTAKTVLFSQTTMDKPTFYDIARVLREKIAEVVIGTFEESALDFHAKDTICGQVAGRDKKLREYAATNECDGIRCRPELFERKSAVRHLPGSESPVVLHRAGKRIAAGVVLRVRRRWVSPAPHRHHSG